MSVCANCGIDYPTLCVKDGFLCLPGKLFREVAAATNCHTLSVDSTFRNTDPCRQLQSVLDNGNLCNSSNNICNHLSTIHSFTPDPRTVTGLLDQTAPELLDQTVPKLLYQTVPEFFDQTVPKLWFFEQDVPEVCRADCHRLVFEQVPSQVWRFSENSNQASFLGVSSLEADCYFGAGCSYRLILRTSYLFWLVLPRFLRRRRRLITDNLRWVLLIIWDGFYPKEEFWLCCLSCKGSVCRRLEITMEICVENSLSRVCRFNLG